MADLPPNNPLPGAPTGAEPLKKSTGKVQPKKETVRINLPPKPTAAPTIKLPTLPPGGPTGAPSPAFAAPSAAGVSLKAASAPVAAPAPATGTKTGAAPVSAQRPSAAPRSSATPVPSSIKSLDRILIYAAGVAGLVAVGGVVWVFLTLKNVVENFSS